MTSGAAGRMRHTARVPQLCIAQDAAADELLGRDPLALVLAMLLDEHVSRGTVRAC